ncbi:hypothetical protein EPA93_48095 [Ktedonosporobacter rubrisoli]|uniref:Uncharacterized protein n=1 Tax=Ktedonosporobacter rubrisoli TaxID=2509675 RepID=A0A4P6K6R5_KTERU|nr:hypothetical protein [Ktedonosporobacter rubrisoli]QBD83316.1 hypothetical protein EPA93_48095 [Ktedonosporobacter rubrisoli]
MWKNAATDWQSGLTVYIFLVEHLLVGGQRRHPELVWPVLGVQFLAMAAVATLAALCFGYWRSLHALVPTDLAVFAYAGIGTILIPVVLRLRCRPRASASTRSLPGCLGSDLEYCADDRSASRHPGVFLERAQILAAVWFPGECRCAAPSVGERAERGVQSGRRFQRRDHPSSPTGCATRLPTRYSDNKGSF